MTWQRGRETVDRLLEMRELERVQPSEAVADRLLSDARAHLASADSIVATDAPGALQLAYDAARKACTALLATQGLRPTTSGGHVAVQTAIEEQFNGPSGVQSFARFSRLRRRRAASEYPADMTTPTVDVDEARSGIDVATQIVDDADRLLRSGRLTVFGP
jgi:hypothetical protein